MKKYFLISFFIFTLILPSLALSMLNISNLPKADQQAIKKKFPMYKKIKSQYKLDIILKYLVQTQNYKKAALIRTSRGSYQIKIANLKKIKNIRFFGNKNMSSKELKKILSITEGQTYNKHDMIDNAKKIKIAYNDNGYRNAIVQIDLKTKESSNEVSIEFKIKEKQLIQIADIYIETNNKKLKKNLIRTLKKFKNKPISQKTFKLIENKAISYLIKHGYLLSQLKLEIIKYSKDSTKAFLTFKLSHPIQYEFKIIGNHYYSRSSILNILQINKRYGKGVSPYNQMIHRLTKKYLKKGFAQIQVSVSQKGQGLFKELVTFNISEGPSFKIGNISINGNISRPPKYYASFLKSSFGLPLLKKDFFREADLKRKYKNLIAYLKNQGFLKAEIQFSRLKYVDDSVQIFVVINEGIQTKISEIKFKGNKEFSSETLKKISGFKKGDPLNFKKFEESIKKIKEFYLSKGYLEMDFINPKKQNLIKYSNSYLNAAIKYHISEGNLEKISSIIIKGNDLTKKETILRQLTFKNGDILTPKIIQESKLNLTRSGLFNFVEIITEKKGKGIKNAVILVNERNPGQFKLGLGVNSQLGLTLRAYSELSYENILGTGRAISSSINIKAVEQATKISKSLSGLFSLSYFEPGLFNLPFDGRINAIVDRNIYNISTKDNKVDFTENRRFDLLIEKQISKKVKINWTIWSNEVEKFYSNPASNSLNLAKDITVATTGPDFYIDNRDNPFLPTTGNYFSANIKYSSKDLGSSDLIKFLKSEFDYRTYWDISKQKKIIWANAIRGGYIKNMHPNPNSGIPFSKSFFLGGQSTIRGFGGSREIERIPNNLIIDIDPQNPNQLIETKNISYSLIKSELRIPLFDPFGGAIFYDGGGVFIQGKEQQKAYRQSYGVGLRMNTPFGPLSLDIAWKHRPQTYPNGEKESHFGIHFSIGTF